MKGLIFGEADSWVASHPNRMDIACFVGLVNRRMEWRDGATRPVPVPGAVLQCLSDLGWCTPPYGVPAAQIDRLENIPVPLDDWATFDALFAWDARLLKANDALPSGTTYLGAAVRSFFEQGGRRCYVIRVGDPLPFDTPRSVRKDVVKDLLLPGYPGSLAVSALDQSTWRGIGHLYGLPDVTFVCLPDLPDLLASDLGPINFERTIEIPEQFVECSENIIDDDEDTPPDRVRAPACGEQSYGEWAHAIQLIGQMLHNTRREVQLVAAIPLPDVQLNPAVEDVSTMGDPLIGLFDQPLNSGIHVRGGIASAFVQLVYPWLQTRGSLGLPQQLEGAEGAVIGLLAQLAMTQGAFHSAVDAPLVDVYDLEPVPGPNQITREHGAPIPSAMIDRITLVGQRSLGRFELISDVTTSLEPVYRPAQINRLIASVVRAARRIGVDLVDPRPR